MYVDYMQENMCKFGNGQSMSHLQWDCTVTQIITYLGLQPLLRSSPSVDYCNSVWLASPQSSRGRPCPCPPQVEPQGWAGTAGEPQASQWGLLHVCPLPALLKNDRGEGRDSQGLALGAWGRLVDMVMMMCIFLFTQSILLDFELMDVKPHIWA